VEKVEDLSGVAKSFFEAYPKGGVFSLSGPLGVGKTTLVKALVSQLCEKNNTAAPRVLSPSFVVHLHYPISPAVHHFDLYRLELLSAESLVEIGYWEAWEEANRQGSYVFVEWPEKASGQTLKVTARIELAFQGTHRTILIQSHTVS
jgi:tRNA threonylcarbamoyladenosine biosynthesis protein TsaE